LTLHSASTLYTVPLHDALPIYASLYVDGVLKAFRPVEPNYIGTVNSTRIGSETCCGGNSFPGTIEEVRVWNVPLSPQQVHAHLEDRKSTRLNSSHVKNSYAVLC